MSSTRKPCSLRVRHSEIFSRGPEYERGSNHIKPKYITGMSYPSCRVQFPAQVSLARLVSAAPQEGVAVGLECQQQQQHLLVFYHFLVFLREFLSLRVLASLPSSMRVACAKSLPGTKQHDVSAQCKI
jgi:hypothetical protein